MAGMAGHGGFGDMDLTYLDDLPAVNDETLDLDALGLGTGNNLDPIIVEP